MKEKYPIVFLCQLMGVSKSGYYKWKNRKGQLNRYEQDRQLLTKLLAEQHRKHPSHGYHMLANDVFQATVGFSLIILPTSAVKRLESTPKQESTDTKRRKQRNMWSFRMK